MWASIMSSQAPSLSKSSALTRLALRSRLQVRSEGYEAELGDPPPELTGVVETLAD
jgi:hypothetical protein